MKEKLSIKEAAKIWGVGKMAIYATIKSGKLIAKMVEGRWEVDPEDLKEYIAHRYCRSKTRDASGNLVYDKTKGLYTPSEAAKLLGWKVQKIYQLLRKGEIPVRRNGKWSYVIFKGDLEKYGIPKKNLWDKNNS